MRIALFESMRKVVEAMATRTSTVLAHAEITGIDFDCLAYEELILQVVLHSMVP